MKWWGFIPLMAASCVNGFFNLAHFAIAYEMAVHVAAGRAGEATVSGIINSSANFVGFFFILGLTPFLEQGTEINVQVASGTMLAILLIALRLMIGARIPT